MIPNAVLKTFMNATTVPPELAGFDLAPVLDWLEANKTTVKQKLAWLHEPMCAPMHINADGIEHLQLTALEITEIIHRFPEAARKRSALRNLRGMPVTWFRRGMNPASPEITENIAEALGPRAFVPGHNTPIIWTRDHKANQIELFHLGGTPPEIARYMATHALIHEYTHTILNPLWYSKGEEYRIKIPGQEEMNGPMFMVKFAVAATPHPAISHYSATYRPFPAFPNEDIFNVCVGEEFCESVAALMLGYIYCNDPERCFDPFRDRPEVKQLVVDFLNAEHVFNI